VGRSRFRDNSLIRLRGVWEKVGELRRRIRDKSSSGIVTCVLSRSIPSIEATIDYLTLSVITCLVVVMTTEVELQEIRNELMLIRKLLESSLTPGQFEFYRNSVKNNPTLKGHIKNLNENVDYISLVDTKQG